MVIHRNVSLKPFNTFGIDVSAQLFVNIEEIEDLKEVYLSDKFMSYPKLVIGGGSNILLTGNQRKCVLRMRIEGIEILKEDSRNVWVKVGAGENWHQFVLWAIENNYSGIENLSLIPGTVGAAPMQNIGAYGVEIKDVFDHLEAYEIKSSEVRKFYAKDCRFGYRFSVFKGDLKNKFIISSVTFKLNKTPRFNLEYGTIKETLKKLGYEKLSIRAVSEAVIHIRQSKLPDPNLIGNAGSFFKNPIIEKEHFESIQEAFENVPGYTINENWVKIPAAWMIDQSSWKGKREGDAGVHDKQPLVLVNYGKATGIEILKLSEKIQNSVQKKFGVTLEREVNVI